MKINRVLFDSEFELSESDYNEFIENSGTDFTFDEFKESEKEFYLEDLLNTISTIDGISVICGTLGLWKGEYPIIPLRVDTMEKAVLKCLKNADSYIIKQVNGHLEIEASHHDGTNYYQVYLLNEKGENSNNGNLENRRYHKAIKEI